MTRLFDRVIERTEAWLVDLDVERDATAKVIARGEPTQWLLAHLARLEKEREDVVALLLQLREMQRQNHPALLLGIRPQRQLKVPLRRRGQQQTRKEA